MREGENKEISILGFIVNFLFIASGVVAVFAFVTDYSPSLNAIIIGGVLGVLFFFILLYEIYEYKENSVAVFMNGKVSFKIYCLIIYFSGFICLGIYGACYSLHLLTSKEVFLKEVVYLTKPTGTRLRKCNARVVVTERYSQSRRSYCVSKDEYNLVFRSTIDLNDKRSTIFNVKYKKSFFGKNFYSIKII